MKLKEIVGETSFLDWDEVDTERLLIFKRKYILKKNKDIGNLNSNRLK